MVDGGVDRNLRLARRLAHRRLQGLQMEKKSGPSIVTMSEGRQASALPLSHRRDDKQRRLGWRIEASGPVDKARALVSNRIEKKSRLHWVTVVMTTARSCGMSHRAHTYIVA